MNLPASIMAGLGPVASWVWNTSLLILLPALVVLALGRWQGFPARWRGWLAAIVLVRLLLPWVPEVSWRPAWATPLQSIQTTTATTTAVESRVSAGERSKPQTIEGVPRVVGRVETAAAGVVGMAPSTSFNLPSLAALAAWLWLAGAVGVACWIVYSHAVLHRLLTRCRARADASLHRDLEWCLQRMDVSRACDLWIVRGLPTVAVHGWLRPVILVPEGLHERFSTEEIRGMFLHELAHVRRGDLIWGRVMLVVCALHWFNPLVWLLARRMRADAELECDRIALERLSHTERCHYGEALLKTLEFSPACVPAPAVPFFRHAKEIQTRIQMIALPRSSAVARYAAFVIAPALACLTLTTASSADREGAKSAEEKAKGDGEQPKAGPREGEQPKAGPRDGEERKAGPRDGEQKKNGARDGEGRKEGMRDGEARKEGARDGEARKNGPRDGEGQRKGPRDGEVRKEGARERDGEGAARRGPREGEAARGARDGKEGEAVVLTLIDKGENVSIGGKTMPIGKLRGYFSQQEKGMSLVLKADPDVPYKAVTEALDAARDNGIWNVAFATAGEDGSGTKKSSRDRER